MSTTYLCQTCAAPFTSNRKATYCPVCRHARKLERRRRCYDKQRKNKVASTKRCVICGKAFICPPSHAGRLHTCDSADCRTQNRRNRHTQGAYQAVEEMRLAGVHRSPKTGRFDTHIHAKAWQIMSPDGAIYAFRNLRLWVDQHADLYDGTPDQAYRGLIRVKAIAVGKIKTSAASSWKGWRLLRWEE